MKKPFMIYRFIPMVLLGMPLFISCTRAPLKQVKPAFYYWNTRFTLDSSEKNDLSGKVLYLRFFDVVYDQASQEFRPQAPLLFSDNLQFIKTYIPVVFITNQSLQHAAMGQMDRLCDHILDKISSLSSGIGHGYSEVQMDCDWTSGTRKKYFMLLQKMQRRLHGRNIRLSVTLRLHQIKYVHRTGIPPADRAMLMFYNMGDWKRPQTRNSIYDLQIADRYLDRLQDYPLPLDLALPLLRQTIVYRNGHFLTFLNYIAEDHLLKYAFLKKEHGMHRFRVVKDTFALGLNLRKGDLLRSESCDFQKLMEGKKQLFSRIQNPELTLALFHLDERLLKYYSHDQIKKIFSSLQ